jgi:hypothetical protein
MNSESILFSIGVCDPSPKRVKGDAYPSVETVSSSGARQSETLRDGRFCAMTGAKPLVRITRYALRALA